MICCLDISKLIDEFISLYLEVFPVTQSPHYVVQCTSYDIVLSNEHTLYNFMYIMQKCLYYSINTFIVKHTTHRRATPMTHKVIGEDS